MNGRYYYQSTRLDANGKRQSAFLAKLGDEETMRREWARLHPYAHSILTQRRTVDFDGEMVYFVQIDRAVKVGYTSSKRRLRLRIDHFQVASPKPVKLIGAVPGTREDEKKAHRALAAYSLSGEWFSQRREVTEYIKQALEQNKIP
jgi:hypothetical protein